jgi:hypothetical protein
LLRSHSTLNIIAFVVIVLALMVPNRISAISISSFLFFPLEFLIIGLLLLLPGRAGLVIRWLMAALLALGAIFKCADMATFKVFARPFNPVFDGYLFVNGMNLLNGAIGKAGALLVAVLLVLVVLVIVVGAFWVLGRAQRLLCISVRRSMAFLMSGLALWLVLFLVESPRASVQFYQHLSAHARDILVTATDIKSFSVELDKPDAFARANENVLARLRDKDVLVIFVESYGRTVLDNPEYAPHIRPLLERTTGELAEKGFAVRSGFLTSPTVGGLSWLAHGTAMSGLWIDNQIRYNSLMISERPTLNRVFNQAGWRTVAVMPAITMDWPEGNYYGYDHIYDAHNLGYQGKPFNWVTMPDQYTLAAFHARELTQTSRTPVMAEIALISSHAPWTPIPELIDWNSVGDGTVFNTQVTSGDSPEEVWKDNARIRLQFRLSIDYALQTIASYVMNYGDDNLVVLVLGDHQPAPIVTGDSSHLTNGTRDVPIHLIARDPKVMKAVAHWQWTHGMLPAADAPVWRMDELRNRLIETFSLPAR